MKQYLELVNDVLENGTPKPNRTEIPTPYTVFGRQIRFDLSEGLPVLTTKKMAIKACVAELLWFIEGGTDERRLAEIQYGKDRSRLKDKRTIWSDNYEAWRGKKVSEVDYGYLGCIYGAQWREFEISDWGEIAEFDQLKWLINELKINPNSRKMIMLSYSPAQIEDAALTACHTQVQFQVQNGKLNCMWTQASVDLFLGLPFNIMSYAILTHMLAKEAGLEVGELIGSLGDVHIYENAVDNLKEQLSREPLPLPKLWLNPEKNIFSYTVDDVKLIDYQSHDALKAKMAV
jgi:thymidylate synthase|nr:MAG TPA: Thymidylate synthase [Bacteriophage sp.]